MKIQILGTGCAKCKKLEENARVATHGMEVVIEKVSHIADIIAFGVMMTPALAINDEVKSSGKVLSPEQIKSLLT